MIVLEGMDGSGKTSLARRLSDDLQLPIHERASTSIGGPVPNIWQWVMRDVLTIHTQQPAIYDRHPLISQVIYGPIIRQKLEPEFTDPEARAIYRKWARNVFVVFCDPGDEAMSRSLSRDPNQMPGVLDMFPTLSLMYRVFFATYSGNWHHWDYNHPYDYETLLYKLHNHLHDFTTKRTPANV